MLDLFCSYIRITPCFVSQDTVLYASSRDYRWAGVRWGTGAARIGGPGTSGCRRVDEGETSGYYSGTLPHRIARTATIMWARTA